MTGITIRKSIQPKNGTGHSARAGIALAATLLALGAAAIPAVGAPSISLSSPVDLGSLTVGEIVPIDVTLSGLPEGTDFIFNLNTSVLFPGSLLTPVPDPGNTSGLTATTDPGSIFTYSDQVANFDAASSLNAGSAVGIFSDSSPSSSHSISQNGLYYTFTVEAAASGSGTISFDTASGANEYASDDTGFNYASIPVSAPLDFTVAAVPEPSQDAALGIGVLGLAGLMLGAWRRRV
jgi:hypothetical protein